MPSLAFTIFHPDHSHSHWSAVIISPWIRFAYHDTWICWAFIHIPHGKSWVTGFFFFWLFFVFYVFVLSTWWFPSMSCIRVSYRSVYLNRHKRYHDHKCIFSGFTHCSSIAFLLFCDLGELSLGLLHASQYSHIGLHPVSKSFSIICISGS